jgi:predicted RNA-binding Zn ribbon-like protein
VETHQHTADATDVALATLAADAIELLTGSGRQDIRACRAPNCVLMFFRDNPRRRWCSAACGNRARQARHYARTRRG